MRHLLVVPASAAQCVLFNAWQNLSITHVTKMKQNFHSTATITVTRCDLLSNLRFD